MKTLSQLFDSLRVTVVTLLICCVAYPLAILAFAQVAAKDSAEGSILTDASGKVIGSRLIAQNFVNPRYFWPRPSAAGYNAAAATGSNLSPGNSKLTDRAKELITRFGATAAKPLPVDLATASGSGLDPHITAASATWQADRVAAARHVPRTAIDALIEKTSFPLGGKMDGERIVNVLELNLALDKLP
jgi:K+-transporting ATPase ATPase C chain